MRSKRFSLSRGTRLGKGAKGAHATLIGCGICAAVFLTFGLLPAQARAQDKSTADAPVAAPFVGQAACSSSGCHGGGGEKHDQCIRFTKLDIHTRSAATLTLARSARIAEILNIADPVHSSRCTVCHAPFQAQATTEAIAKILDPASGVSCENCHGAAQTWLLSHTRPDFTHQDRVHAGMHDLAGLYARANSCVACHQNVDADILHAGHPELIFELDGQSVTEPKHWRESTNWSGAQTWLVGQAVALREMSWQISRETPESASAPERWSALVWLVATVTTSTEAPVANASHENVVQAQTWADNLARQTSATVWPANSTRDSLNRLAATASNFRATTPGTLQARRAERLVLALDRLIIALNDEAVSNRVDPSLVQLFKDAQSIPDFDSAKFADHLEAFQKLLGN